MFFSTPLPLTDNPTDSSIATIFSEVWTSGTLTEPERRAIHHALLSETLSADAHMAITRLIHAIKRGWLTVV